jgi:hypothetical protein
MTMKARTTVAGVFAVAVVSAQLHQPLSVATVRRYAAALRGRSRYVACRTRPAPGQPLKSHSASRLMTMTQEGRFGCVARFLLVDLCAGQDGSWSRGQRRLGSANQDMRRRTGHSSFEPRCESDAHGNRRGRAVPVLDITQPVRRFSGRLAQRKPPRRRWR